MNTLHHFHSYHVLEKSFNVTNISLIHMKMGSLELKDFRPISLISGVYKIIAKLLVERLRKVVSKLINNHHMTFIKGRQIMDVALIAHEYEDSRPKRQ